jgi:hypothetical protein
MKKIPLTGAMFGLLAFGCSAQPSDESARLTSERAAPSPRVFPDRASPTTEGLDCHAYGQYTAALATFTVDCLGTIGPETYRVGSSGNLERNFEACTSEGSKLAAIDGLLSLQQRVTAFPLARECMAGRYADFLRSFADSGVSECPIWHKERTVNPITSQVVEAVSPSLGRVARAALAATADELVIEQAARFPEELEEKNLYRVRYADPAGAVGQVALGASAALCAGGFDGFVLQTSNDLVLTDPVVWLLDTTYPSAAADPFLRPGYYHPMSFYGPPPGAQFANYARYAPCPGCPPERCSYYAGIHKLTRLQADCLDASDITTCLAYCGPPLP